MRDSEARLAWIEQLVSGTATAETKRSAVVIAARTGAIAVGFDDVVEVTRGSDVRPFAFLPRAFSGVMDRSVELVPVIDLSAAGSCAQRVLVVRVGKVKLGLGFSGEPDVVDLDEREASDAPRAFQAGQTRDGAALPVPFVGAGRTVASPLGPAALLDVEATVRALLDDVRAERTER